MNIKNVPGFYEKLHAMEKPVEIDGETYYTIEDVPEDDKELEKLRLILWGADYGQRETVAI